MSANAFSCSISSFSRYLSQKTRFTTLSRASRCSSTLLSQTSPATISVRSFLAIFIIFSASNSMSSPLSFLRNPGMTAIRPFILSSLSFRFSSSFLRGYPRYGFSSVPWGILHTFPGSTPWFLSSNSCRWLWTITALYLFSFFWKGIVSGSLVYGWCTVCIVITVLSASSCCCAHSVILIISSL